MKKVLVTGAGGFVGNQVLRSLEKYNCEVSVITSKPSQHFRKFRNVANIIHSTNLFEEKKEWFLEHLNQVDIVIHLAWYANNSGYENHTDNVKCLLGTIRLGSAFRESSAAKFIGTGSCVEYRLDGTPLNINSPVEPTSLYASCKAAAFYALKGMICEVGKKFLWCRLFFIYGEGQHQNKLHSYLENRLKNDLSVKLSTGEQKRDYLNVEVVGEKLVGLAFSDYSGIQNICSGVGKSVREIAIQVAKRHNKEHLLTFGGRQELPMDQIDIVGVEAKIE